MSEAVKLVLKSVTGQNLDARIWLPACQPIAVLQLVHGMAEHIDRYDATAKALNEYGVIVTGHTHLGHGTKTPVPGYFGEKGGWQNLLEDIHRLREKTQSQYPNLPYILLGHSMGSFLVRCYLTEHGEGLAGAVLSGTGYYSPALVKGGLILAALERLTGKKKKPSPLINSVGFGSLNKPFEPARTPFDWLSRTEEEVDRYIADPACGFIFTATGYRDLFSGLDRLNRVGDLKKIPVKLPVLFFSGNSDPVGAMGKGVKKVASQFMDAGIRDVAVRLYPEGRHEMLNGPDRQQVWKDLGDWIKEKCRDDR